MPFSDEINKDITPEVVEVSVVKKSKRALVFLADFFLNFIISFFVFNLAIVPISKATSGYEDKNSQYIAAQKEAFDVLYKNEILFSKYESNFEEYYSMSDSISYTYDRFLSYYVIDEGITPSEDKKMTHDIKNEVAFTFFNNIRGKKETYVELFNKYNATDTYFTYNGNLFTLNSNVKNELLSHFDYKQGYTLTETGKTYYQHIQENVFLKLYSDIINDIKTNNLTYTDSSGRTYDYQAAQGVVKDIENYHINLLTYSAIGTYVFVWAIYYLLLPLLLKNGRTLGMKILKVDRINPIKVATLSKWMITLNSIYYLFSNLAFIMFLPLFLISFNYLFNLTILFSLSMISLVYIIGSLIFLMFSSFNQTLSDKLTRSALILSDDLDAVYRSRGYLNDRGN